MSINILVTEDESIVRKDIEQTLETAGVMFETIKWLPAVKVI